MPDDSSESRLAIDRETRSIAAEDSTALAATVFRPSDEAPSGWLTIHSAIAMPRRFYGRLARWFAERGFAVITYDYRGIGDSSRGGMRHETATVNDWMRFDLPAVVAWAERQADGLPVYTLGHSLGGQILGSLGDQFDIDAAVAVSAQSGYWRRQYPGEKWKVAVGMSVVVPIVARVAGYLPWSSVFGGEDLPKPAALQWAGWCRNPDYLFGDDDAWNPEGFAEFSAPMLAYSFEDDEWGYRKAVDWMMDRYTGAEVDRRHVAPDDLGLEEIGHFGFFYPELEPLWEESRQHFVTAGE